jgi:hypothetical protein
MKSKRNPLEIRMQRFEGSGQIKALVKNCRSRCACFWLDVENVSGSGICIVHNAHGHIPFSIDDELQVTLDTSCAVFRRPIHVRARVIWRRDNEAARLIGSAEPLTCLGCQILLVDPLHSQDWQAGLERLHQRAEQQRVLMPVFVARS